MPASLPSERLINAVTTLCPACRSEMTLKHAADSKDHSVHTFKCPECPRLLRKIVKIGDPMKCPETTGWLHGQLLAPT
jgi:transposase-like protein